MKPSPVLLYVARRDPDSHAVLPIGRVVLDACGGYEFSYIRNVQRARYQGFPLLVSFPDVDQVYRSRELPPVLHHRLMRKRRPDYPEYVRQLGLDPDSAEPFTILARSGGRRVTDRVELFAPPTRSADGRLESVLLARDVREIEGAEDAIAGLRPGDRLRAVPNPAVPYNLGPAFSPRVSHTAGHAGAHRASEPSEPSHPRSLLLRHGSHTVGYLPDPLASDLRCQPSDIEVVVRQVNPPPAPVDHRLLLCVRFPAVEPLPFSGPEYQSMAEDATPFAA